MKIRVRLLGFYQMMIGRMYQTFELPEEANLEDLWAHFQETFVQLRTDDMKRIAGMAVNGNYVNKARWNSCRLQGGDKVDLLSQMAGG